MDEKQYNHFLEALDEMSKLPERCMPPVIRLKDIEKEVNRLRAASTTELFEPGRGRRYRILMKRARRTILRIDRMALQRPVMVRQPSFSAMRSRLSLAA